YQYDNHIEIMNPGGLYGQARPENFPHVNDYRNSVVAEMMKTLNYVNMFNHGISEVQELLKENNSPEAEFNVNYVTAFSVVIRDEDVAYNTSTVHQLFTNLSTQDKSLIINLKEQQLSTSELQLFTNCSPQSKQLFIKQVITPNIENGIIAMTHPETPHHPWQKYYLTELGLKILEMLQNNKQ
ncbi:MAG: transcriptional regulator, partial [Bacteroidales bacterium]|nr:transcriptional regulator [Bacteroidales bacterium]